MKLNDLDLTHFAAEHSLPACQSEPGWRGALAALRTRLEKAWVGLYAPPPRRLTPLV